MTERIDARTGAPAIEPDAVLAVWHRRKYLALLVAVAAFAGAATVAASLPNLYRATATILVERQQISEAFVRPSVTQELETRIQTIHEQVLSRARLTDVITRLDLYRELRGVVPMEALVDRMRREVVLALRGVDQTTGRRATIAFTLSYTGRDPATVARVANALAEMHVDENAANREQQATRTAEFLKAQLTDVKADLDGKAARLGEFHVRYGGELPDQTEVNLATLERLNSQLRLNVEYQLRAMERRQILEAQLTGSGGRPVPQPDTVEARLQTLTRELGELRRQYSEEYPDVVRLRAAIGALEGQAARTGGQAPAVDPVARLGQQLDAADREVASLKAEEASLRRLLAQYDARVENAPKRQQELQQLSRDHEIASERYQTLLTRYEEAQLADNLEQGQNVEQLRILDPALPPRFPMAPNRQWLLLVALVGALALGFAAILIAERLDTSFHTADDLRAFSGLAVLSTIRLIPTAAGARRRRLRLGLVTALAAAGVLVIVVGSYYVAAGNEPLVRLTAPSGS